MKALILNNYKINTLVINKSPYALRNLMSRASWDADAVRNDLQYYVNEHIGDDEGVIVVDETGFLKKGNKSAGVQGYF